MKRKVLLVGNGINLSYKGSKDTTQLLSLLTEDNHMMGRLADTQSSDYLPFSLKAVVASNNNMERCSNVIQQYFDDVEVRKEQKAFIGEIYRLGFDSILTTNYSMEFERTLMNGFKRSSYSRRNLTKAQRELGLYRYSKTSKNGEYPNIWHIHGVTTVKRSIVLDQYYYGKLLAEIAPISKKAVKAKKSGEDLSYDSWVEYFLAGDVYCFGFGMGFEEQDIWWLLSQKARNFPETTFTYYNPETNDENLKPAINMLLDCYNVKMPILGYTIKEDRIDYIDYYNRVIEDISNKIK